MARLVSRSGRSRLPLLLGGLLLGVAVIALAAFYLFPRPGARPAVEGAPSAEPSTSAISSTAPAQEDTAPTGCLGGQQRDSSMVLTAQQQAPHTTFGAVELAAALFRWGLRYPYPNASDVRAVRPVLAPATAAKQEADWNRQFRTSRYSPPPGVKAADGTPYYVTTANGSWLVADGSTRDRVDVQLETHPVTDGAYSTSTVTLEVDLQWIDGSWYLHNLARADARDLANGGTTFTSGC